MKNEIDNKRQDVGNCNSLHPYAGELAPTQHIMRQNKYSEFPILFQGEYSAYFSFVAVFSAV